MNRDANMKPWLLALILSLAASGQAAAQFRDDFDSVRLDPDGVNGWQFFAGDGTATMDFRQGGQGYASIVVDATTDRRGIWWALVERQMSSGMDLNLLRTPGHELRLEARLRVSHAPRRVNLQVLTRRSNDDYANLMEFDIPDAETWQTISMTTRGFDCLPDDVLIGHIALMDWGLELYRVDVDYMRLDVVEVRTAGPDQGSEVPYHPPIPDPRIFEQDLVATDDSMIDLENPDVNLNDWSALPGTKSVRLLGVDGAHESILRWDLSAFAGKKAVGAGLLELTTYSLARKAEEIKDFGLLRVVEILGGDPAWDQKTVTTDSLRRGRPLNRVMNTQPIIDWPVTAGDGGKTYLTISRPVLQRMIDGRTLGIAVTPLGAIDASFYATEEGGRNAPRLRFTVK